MLMTLSKCHVIVQIHIHRSKIQLIMIKLLVLFICFFGGINSDIWEEDMTSQMKIGLAETGYRRIDLRCGADSFKVNVTLDNDFEGVVYTRGSFDNKTSSCYKTYKQGVTLEDNAVLISLEIPFDECRTVMDVADSRYKNTLIVQHDLDFIMPGDAAFALDCSFTPEYRMTTNIATEPEYISKITLVDADPSAAGKQQDGKYLKKSNSPDVSFFPLNDNRKDEL